MLTDISGTTEVRRHNGQCAYGPWVLLADLPAEMAHVAEAISDEVVEASCRDMRHESHADGNTDDSGSVTIGGQRWLYRR